MAQSFVSHVYTILQPFNMDKNETDLFSGLIGSEAMFASVGLTALRLDHRVHSSFTLTDQHRGHTSFTCSLTDTGAMPFVLGLMR